MWKKLNFRVNTIIKDYTRMVIGTVIIAISLNLFMVPNKIAPGGVGGIATVVYYLTNGRISVGTTMAVLNIPLFILGIKYMGRRFVIRTFWGTVLLSIFVDLSSGFFLDIFNKYLNIESNSIYTHDLLLYSLIGGAIMGFGLGLVFKSSATTGGTDFAARIIKHFVNRFTLGEILFFIDSSVVILALISFRSLLLAMYAIVALFVSSKAIDMLTGKVNVTKAVLIVSDESSKIATRLLEDIGKEVTVLSGIGLGTQSERNMILSIFDEDQFPSLMQIVKEEDPMAVIMLSNLLEGYGGNEELSNYEYQSLL